MPDRADITAIILSAMGVASILVARFLLGGSGVIHNAVGVFGPLILFSLSSAPMFAYGAYWAFNVRRALAVPLYRRQAFGIGIIILSLWSTLAVSGDLPANLSLQVTAAISTVTFYFLFAVVFYWIDASILVSRRMDPLVRDTLYWSKIRIPIWIANILTWGSILLLAAYAELTGNLVLLNQLSTGNIQNEALLVVYNFPVVVLLCGVIFIPAIAIRSKWNSRLRMHFLWFAPSPAILLLLFFGVISGPSDFSGFILFLVVILVMGFTLYKSAKSLVPLNQISPQMTVNRVEPIAP